MKKSNKIMALLSVVLLVLLTACSSGSSDKSGNGGSGGDSVTTIKFAHTGSTTHQDQIYAEKFKELIEKSTDHKIKVDIFPNGQLGSEADVIKGVQNNTIDMTEVTADSSMAQVVPSMNVLGVPYLFRDLQHVYKVLDGEIGQKLLEDVNKKSLVALGYSEVGFSNITNSKHKVVEPSDMKGLKMRIQPAPIWEAFMKKLGAVSTSMNFTELYSGLQQGVVDGEENPIATIAAMKFYEVNKYISLTKHSYKANVVVISPKTWEKISEENQEKMKEAAKEAFEYQRDYLAKKEEETIKELKGKGVIITEPNRAAFEEATKDVYKEVSKDVPESLVKEIKSVK
ncbi:TRAP transporter substrate-binding protein [Rummeliibacillus sp. SL167]|uniref:TRAP transporter substrate-binding protein n=1 Tax=Rummeliibacillus sp. SL167 TaxID=2579792 RepID=UPI0011B63554|nr:TRAP transporter substrate-binding protein [Rummeliibacillus sp. SL167]